MAQSPNKSIPDTSTPASLPHRPSSLLEDQSGMNGAPTESLSDSTMRNALELYKARMRVSNKKFMDARIDEIASMDLTDRQKLNMIARFWFSGFETQWPVPTSVHGDDEQSQREKNATSIDDIRNFDIACSEGVEATTLVSEEARETFLDELERLMNENAGFGGERKIRFPEELNSFLKFANGVADVDVRDEGLCGWDIAYNIKSEGVTMQYLRTLVRDTFEGLIVDDEMREEQQMSVIEDHLIVKTGFATGGPAGPSNDGYFWYSYYLFCRKLNEDKSGDEGLEESYEQADGWAWRILFDCTERDLVDEPLIFDTIPEFLEWSSTWADRDAEKIMDKVQSVYNRSEFFVAKDIVRSLASRS